MWIMPVGFQILAMVVGCCGFPVPFQTSDAHISNADTLPAPVLVLQDIMNEDFPDKAATLDDDDLRDDPRSIASVYASFETRKPQGLFNSKLQTSITSCQIAKHPRIYFLCALLI